MGELVTLELQEVEVLAVSLDVIAKGFELLHGRMIGIEGLLILGQLTGIVGNDINHAHLEVLLVEQQVLMLGVDIDKSFTEFLEHRELHGRVVDEGTALTGGCQLAADDGLVGIILDVVLDKEVLHIVAREVELRLDDAFIGSLLDGFRVGALPQQQTDGAEDDTLAGTSLACYHRETLEEVDVELIDKGKVLDI